MSPFAPLWHSGCVPQPDGFANFKIPHAEKIEWMIETNGWALEPIAADYDSDPPRAGYAYTIGLHDSLQFPDIVVFGLTPVAIKGLIDLIVEQVSNGVDIPLDTPVTGLLDNELRCVFASVDTVECGNLFQTAALWYQRRDFPMVQLLWPDRSGWLPGESGFDAALVRAQPVIGRSNRRTV